MSFVAKFNALPLSSLVKRSLNTGLPAVRESLAKDRLFHLLRHVHDSGFDIIKTENLYTFDGEPGFSAV